MIAHQGGGGTFPRGARLGGASQGAHNHLAALLQQLQLLAQPRVCLSCLHSAAADLSVWRDLHRPACLSQNLAPLHTGSGAGAADICSFHDA